MEAGTFAHANVVQVGAPSFADSRTLTFLLRFCASLNRLFGEDWTKVTNGCGAFAFSAISSTREFFNRLYSYMVEMSSFIT